MIAFVSGATISSNRDSARENTDDLKENSKIKSKSKRKNESTNEVRASDFEWIFVNISRNVFDFSNGWVDFYNSSAYELVAFSAVADLELMKRGDIFIGAFSSHFSKLAYYVMAGRQMRLPPFISLDVPLSCDTMDTCATKDIAKRDQSVLDIIQWAPECLRKWDGGWLESDRDPCGIYSSPIQ
jgi:hypothetical protein